VNPIPGQYDLPYVLDLAKRFHKKGYRIYLDFHLSDTWADPQHNNAPVAWPTVLQPLSRTVRKYISDSILAFSRAGVPLSIVSLGNEIRHGMLWPLGQVDVDVFPTQARIANFTNLATLYKAAREGVDDAVHSGAVKPQVMIHIDNGWNLTLQETWFDAFTATGKVRPADWDLFGFSFYPFYGTAATLANLKTTLTALAKKYGKPIHVVETDYPDLCDGADAPALSEPEIPVSVQGQIEWVGEIVKIVKGLPRGLGQGINYWEPAWLNLTSLGSACQDAILFDTDWSQWPKALAYSRDSVNMFKRI
jgi:arabinogalactan endo-1,4-beta-galactosidase